MKRWKVLAISFFVVLAAALALPFLIPTDQYRTALQGLASEKLGKPVEIEQLRFQLLPWPAATLSGIAIGKEKPIKVGSVSVTPELFSLLSEVKVIRSVSVQDLTVNPALLALVDELSKLAPEKSDEPKTLLVKRIEVGGLQLDMDTLKWGPFKADVNLNEAGLESVQAGLEDGSLGLTLLPEAGETYRVALEGKRFKLPIKPALMFDSLQGQGKLTKSSLDMTTFNARFYGGDLQAPVRVDWKEGLRINGKAKAVGVEVAQIVKMLSPANAFSGRLHADGAYDMAAAPPARLADNLKAKVRFEIKDGVLDKVDLASAAKLLTRQGARGGQTQFDQLSGVALVDGKRYQLQEIKVSSGALNAGGNVTINPAKELSGQVTVELKATAALVSVPLNVSGTVEEPILFPSGAALAGAAVGTGLLGPMGTAIGSKAGQALEKLFK